LQRHLIAVDGGDQAHHRPAAGCRLRGVRSGLSVDAVACYGRLDRLLGGSRRMTPTRITPDYGVAPQIEPRDVAEIAALGYRAIMCNRPDGEGPGQPEAAAIRAEAERLGLAFAHVPVISGQMTAEDVADFAAALAELPGPVLAYCRSGTRSRTLWQHAKG